MHLIKQVTLLSRIVEEVLADSLFDEHDLERGFIYQVLMHVVMVLVGNLDLGLQV